MWFYINKSEVTNGVTLVVASYFHPLSFDLLTQTILVSSIQSQTLAHLTPKNTVKTKKKHFIYSIFFMTVMLQISLG